MSQRLTGGGGECVVKLNSSSSALSLHQELKSSAAASLQRIHLKENTETIMNYREDALVYVSKQKTNASIYI